MGTTSAPNWKSKTDVKDYILDNYSGITDIASSKDGYWTVYNTKKYGNRIAFHKVESRNGTWYHKAIDAIDHPFYYDCPLNFLTKKTQYNLEWSSLVRAYHKKKEEAKSVFNSIKNGATFTLSYSRKYRFTPIQNSFTASKFLATHNGQTFKITKGKFEYLQLI